jgi:hypothetical protein
MYMFLDVLEVAVILYLIEYLVRLLQHSSSSDHDTLTAVAPVLKHCRENHLPWDSHYSHHDDDDGRSKAQGGSCENTLLSKYLTRGSLSSWGPSSSSSSVNDLAA